MFNSNLNMYSSNFLINHFNRKYHVSINTSSGGGLYGCNWIDINEHIEYYSTF